MASTSRCAGGRSERPARWPAAGVLALALCGAVPAATRAADCSGGAGPLRLQAEQLAATHARTEPGEARGRAAAALGHAYLRLNRLREAEPLLLEADAALRQPRERAAAALDRANLYLARQEYERADATWQQALAAAPGQGDLELAVELNRLRLPDAQQRLQRLQAAARRIDALPTGNDRVRLALNVAAQARALGPAGTGLALRAYDSARAPAGDAAGHALAAEAYDGLGALYEADRRTDEALRLTERGLWHAQQVAARELLVPLEWRAARLTLQQGRADLALAAYRRAVEHIEAVRADIPVQYLDGRSSFRVTLEPVYLGLTDQLLRRAAASDGEARAALLRQARDTVELIKQTELEDYLGDRCAVGASLRTAGYELPAGTALYYPIILPDRLELLVETRRGIERRSVGVDAGELRRSVLTFVSFLRAQAGYRSQAEHLYGLLLQPVEALLAEQQVHTLVVVPDGVLRLLPMGALHDGTDFVIRRFATATVPGLSLAAAPRAQARRPQALMAGLSEPGPVVEKLSPDLVETVLSDDPALARSARAAGGNDPQRTQARNTALRNALSLPGVKDELDDVGRAIGGTTLLDQAFTLAALRRSLQEQDYTVLHIASHGVFGDSAESTFIMTYDELLTLDGLQQLLSGARLRSRPIELITLSACQTAEGDDRAPLGMSGTAIKARARSALGTLWPVSDAAAQRLMARFYPLLAGGRHGKVEALRAAQLALLDQPRFRHPFFWAPFTLIGDWQ